MEETLSAQIKAHGQEVKYEAITIEFEEPAQQRRYKPDFVLENGIIVESKGRFLTADRKKHKLLKAQYPEMDLRFVFSNPNQRISKTSKTTYAAWCEAHGFQYAAKVIPDAWFKEP